MSTYGKRIARQHMAAHSGLDTEKPTESTIEELRAAVEKLSKEREEARSRYFDSVWKLREAVAKSFNIDPMDLAGVSGGLALR